MALGASIYKAELDISNLDRNYYANRILTVARHPSETEGRMMLRLLCYCLWDSDTIRFAAGLSKEGEPALADTDDTGWISLWVELGVPTVKQLRKAAEAPMWLSWLTAKTVSKPGGNPAAETWRRSGSFLFTV